MEGSLMTDSETAYERFDERYNRDEVPWDDTAPPPEIVALADSMSPGRVLDLGCGYGRAAIYLAERGWHAVGVDFIPKAVEVSAQRAASAGVASRTQFYRASASDLGFLTPGFDLAIDVGCMHSFTEELLRGYHHELLRLLKPGATYVLFAHLREEDEEDTDERPRGIAEELIHELFATGFNLEVVEYGITQVEDKPAWRSGWFWFRRTV